MTDINIFLAGSKTLQGYRDSLVLWANKKNYDYRKSGNPFRLNLVSFSEVGDNQDAYNRFISEESDIVIFMIEGSIHNISKEELRKAKDANHENKRPEIWVFTNNQDESTVSFLEGILGRDYSVDFHSAEDMVIKVHSRIDEYVAVRQKEEEKANQLAQRSTWIKKWKIGTVSCFLFVIFALLGWLIGRQPISSKVQSSESPMLLIAGGGSVANMIENIPDSKIPSLADYPNGYFVHLPTKSAWKMLVEEVVSLQDTRRYYPVCISATEATDKDFCSAQISQQMFLDSAIIVSCKLGEDSLAVYVPKTCAFLRDNKDCLYSQQISVAQLKELLLGGEMNVFSTSFESGTRAGYCHVLNIKNEDLDQYLAGQYSEYSPLSSVSIAGKPYMLLGSQYYQMNAVSSDAVRLIVQADFAKPMMIYFMAYRLKGDRYVIPRETLDFLHATKLHTLDDYVSADGSIKIKNHDHVIYDEKNLFANSAK